MAAKTVGKLDTAEALTHDVPVNRARVYEQALALPEDERLKLAAELLASAPPPEILRAGSSELAKAIHERMESVRRGDAKPVSARAALARLRRPRAGR